MSEFPTPLRFRLGVSATSAWHVTRRPEKTAKGDDWVGATFILNKQAMTVRLHRDRTLVVSCPTAPAGSVRASVVVDADGIHLGELVRTPQAPGVDVPEPSTLPPFRWVLGKDHLGLTYETSRSRPGTWRNRCVNDRQWMSACLTHFASDVWVRVVVYADGRVWIGTPGVGQSLQGHLGEDGLDLGLSDPVATLGLNVGEPGTGRAESA